jgi:uncharacterized protein (TIGR03435 family)
MFPLRLSAGILLTAAALFAQAPPTFEVATVKTAPPLQEAIRSGRLPGMKIDAGRVDISNLSLGDLIPLAYEVKPFQIAGPNWMRENRFDISAKIPEGATQAQVPQMLQALLAERFGLTIRRESKEQPTYALVVAKGGPKVKPADPEPETAPANPAPANSGMTLHGPGGATSVTPDGKGGMVARGPQGNARITPGPGGIHLEFTKITMARFADQLTAMTGRPVIDMTDLKGDYQLALDLSMDDLRNAASMAGVGLPGPGGAAGGSTVAASDPSGGSIFQAVQQAGLKLEPRKSPVEMIVVDHLEKMPTEN